MLCFLKWEITFILNFHSLSCLLVLCAYHWVIFTVCVFVLCWVHYNNPLSLPTPPHQLLGITKFFVFMSWHFQWSSWMGIIFLLKEHCLKELLCTEILPEQLCGSVFLNIPIFFILFLQGWTSFSVFLRWWRWFQAHVLFTHGTLSSAGRNANDSHTACAENSL